MKTMPNPYYVTNYLCRHCGGREARTAWINEFGTIVGDCRRCGCGSDHITIGIMHNGKVIPICPTCEHPVIGMNCACDRRVA